MKITNINLKVVNKKAILSGQIILNSGKVHDLFFEVDETLKDYIAPDASAFLAAALPLAMLKKEKIEIEGSISKKLMANTPEIMKILVSWNKGFTLVKIKSKTTLDIKKPRITGAFFSGGADSFYTYLKNSKRIDSPIFVHGFDIDVNNFDLYQKIEKNITKISKTKKKNLIKVRTNIREIFDNYFEWILYHPFAIASVALFLRNGVKESYISCGQPSRNIPHLYLTPELDRLWTTETMKLNHYGCNADKTAKLKFLSNFKLAMNNLRVCWVNKKGKYNCCECEKCFRNMLGLYISNSLQKSNTFDKKINTENLRNIRLDTYVIKYFQAIREQLRLKNDQTEVSSALDDCINRNTHPKLSLRFYQTLRDSIRSLDQKYNRNRVYWFLSSKGIIK